MASGKIIRFRLTTVLIVFALVAGFFGFARWRYLQKLSEIRQLEADGVHFEYSAGDATLLEVAATGKRKTLQPYDGWVVLYQLGATRYQIGQKVFDNTYNEYLKSLCERAIVLNLPELGVELRYPKGSLADRILGEGPVIPAKMLKDWLKKK